MGKLRRPPALGVDAGPDGMTMPPPFFLVKNQAARLVFERGPPPPKIRITRIPYLNVKENDLPPQPLPALPDPPRSPVGQ
jgi:hypothetical protein